MNKVAWPVVDKKKALSFLEEVLDSNRWAISGYHTGHQTKEGAFVDRFADKFNAKHCSLCTNGSSALVLALEALDIGYGDEVIIPSLTWVATASSVMRVNALPVLADVDLDTFCISPDSIRKMITPLTKAIIPVHLYGSMADMDSIMMIAEEYNLKVIEDCAQAYGSQWNGKFAGTIGDFGTFSFQQGKLLTSGEGGAIITNNSSYFEKLEQLRMDSRIMKPIGEDLQYGEMEIEVKGEVHGANYSLSEFQSALLLSQIDNFDNLNNERTKNVQLLDSQIKKMRGIRSTKAKENNNYRTFYSFSIEVLDDDKSSDDLVIELQNNLKLGDFFIHKIYTPIHLNKIFCPWTKKRFSIFKQLENDWRDLSLPNSEKIAKRGIALHHSLLLNEDVCLMILDTLRKFLAGKKSR